MLLLDPPPLPDESLYSLICRAYLLDAGFTHRKTLKYIFDPMMQGSDLEMIGSRFYWFWDTCLKYYWSLPRAVMETTLFRLYAPMLTLTNRKHILKWIGRDSLSIRLMLEQFFYVHSLDLYYLKFCPNCIETDIDQHGVAYWHRSHCCKYAFACYRHACKLVPVGVIPTGAECLFLPSCSDATKGREIKLLIEKQIYQQLNQLDNTSVSPEELKQHFDINDGASMLVQNEISHHFRSSDMEALEIRHQFADGVEKEWVLEAVQVGNKVHSPEVLAINSFFSVCKYNKISDA